jgi:hypothetical protein
MGRKPSLIVSAEAILKSRTGRSLTRTTVPITAENIEEFTPAPETIAEATRRFEELGFSVPASGVTLTLRGRPAQFEEVFGVKLAPEKDAPTGGVVAQTEGDPVVPDSLRDVVEKVVFPEPAEYFP